MSDLPLNEDEIMEAVLKKITGPSGAIWRWFPRETRVDGAGLPRYTSFTEYVCQPGVTDGKAVTFGEFYGDFGKRMAILQAKIDAVSAEVPTSMLARDLDRDLPIYAGGSGELNKNGEWVNRAISGLPEFVDHLVTCRKQFVYGLISASSYDIRTGLTYPGISDLLTESDMHTSAYSAMKKDIEGYFDEALKTVLD